MKKQAVINLLVWGVIMLISYCLANVLWIAITKPEQITFGHF